MVEATPELVQRKVAQLFAPHEREEAERVLDAYGSADHHLDKHRVHLAALKVSAGRLDALATAIEVASDDYRNLLMSAEYPEQALTPLTAPSEVIDRVRAWDRQQYRRWLEGAHPVLLSPLTDGCRELLRQPLLGRWIAVLLGDVAPSEPCNYTWVLRVEDRHTAAERLFVVARPNPSAPIAGGSHLMILFDLRDSGVTAPASDRWANRDDFLTAALELAAARLNSRRD